MMSFWSVSVVTTMSQPSRIIASFSHQCLTCCSSESLSMTKTTMVNHVRRVLAHKSPPSKSAKDQMSRTKLSTILTIHHPYLFLRACVARFCVSPCFYFSMSWGKSVGLSLRLLFFGQCARPQRGILKTFSKHTYDRFFNKGRFLMKTKLFRLD